MKIIECLKLMTTAKYELELARAREQGRMQVRDLIIDIQAALPNSSTTKINLLNKIIRDIDPGYCFTRIAPIPRKRLTKVTTEEHAAVVGKVE
jgi:hypothetical protein